MAATNSSAAVIDGVAITLSGLCLVHCLFLPMMSVALPVLGIWAEMEWLHKVFVAVALPFALLAATSRRADWRVIGLIGTGMALLLAGAFVEAWHDYETLLTVSGAISLAVGHALRWSRGHETDQS
jgi:membrane-bound ClpP family serine protease